MPVGGFLPVRSPRSRQEEYQATILLLNKCGTVGPLLTMQWRRAEIGARSQAGQTQNIKVAEMRYQCASVTENPTVGEK